VFDKTIAEVFGAKKVRLYYFYTDDEAEARSYHYYPDEIHAKRLEVRRLPPLSVVFVFV